ncbi:MAG: 2-amino-4-hydroxy-6-hydroxymethyldihydropteridine diphosphokinase [Colwellia sp.]|nr:2-amino-4-hydroxy-6-hydroxymethyldihydropteridine diphosphokinase [Colwellia sp.]
MAKVYVGLGSNLSDPKKQIHLAVDALANIEHSQLTNISSLYFSRPMGPQDQPDYMNAVAEISTQLSPLNLLDELQAIERLAGRVRKDNRWGARILDLDILLFDNEIIHHERLTVPHYGLELREFVLLPLAEISPELILPNGNNILALSQNIETNGLKIHSKLR